MHRCYSGLYQQNYGCEPTDQRNCKIPVSIFTLSWFFYFFGHCHLGIFPGFLFPVSFLWFPTGTFPDL